MKSATSISTIAELFLQSSNGAIVGTDSDELKTAIRIACHFKCFLDALSLGKYPSTRDPKTLEMVDTLRSGIDSFFCLAALNVVIKKSIRCQLNPCATVDFARYRATYRIVYEKMCRDSLPIQDRLACLLELNKLHFVFIGFSME